MPYTAWSVNRFLPSSSQPPSHDSGFDVTYLFRHFFGWFAFAHLLISYLTSFSSLFPNCSVTRALYSCTVGRFGTSVCTAVPKGPPSSFNKFDSYPLDMNLRNTRNAEIAQLWERPYQRSNNKKRLPCLRKGVF